MPAWSERDQRGTQRGQVVSDSGLSGAREGTERCGHNLSPPTDPRGPRCTAYDNVCNHSARHAIRAACKSAASRRRDRSLHPPTYPWVAEPGRVASGQVGSVTKRQWRGAVTPAGHVTKQRSRYTPVVFTLPHSKWQSTQLKHRDAPAAPHESNSSRFFPPLPLPLPGHPSQRHTAYKNNVFISIEAGVEAHGPQRSDSRLAPRAAANKQIKSLTSCAPAASSTHAKPARPLQNSGARRRRG